tara:strand:+ start:340 stop:840 length:501 start_codon:yes stop_codon:yes gene_type:complete
MKSIIKINIDNTIEIIDLNIKNSNIINKLQKISTSKDSDNITELYNWNNNQIRAYGWTSGINKNEHKLPPDGKSTINIKLSDEIVLYGNIFIIAFNKTKIIDYSIAEYGELHYILTSTDYDSNDSDSNDSDSNDLNKIQKSNNLEIINENNENKDNLLDEDLTEYK